MSCSQDVKSDASISDENINDDPDLKEFDFTIKTTWSDLQLEVEGKTLYVTRSFLAMISPVFRRMFKSDFKQKEAKSINLLDKKYEDILTILRCSIPWPSVIVTDENVLQILPLAHEYQMTGLLNDCCVCLNKQLESLSDDHDSLFDDDDEGVRLCKICLLADKYGLTNVMEKCLKTFTSITSDQYRDLKLFNMIPTDIRYRVLYGRLKAIDPKVPCKVQFKKR